MNDTASVGRDFSDLYAGQSVLVPGPYDGRFWNVWNWVVAPLGVAATVAWGTLTTVNPLWVALSYYLMISGATLSFHRYFSHSAFKTSRPFQAVLAVWGCYSGQTGPISWELTHREHHTRCEVDGDPHAIAEGFWHAHGFFLWNYEARWRDVRRSRWRRFPEILFVERWAPAIYYAFGAIWLAATGFTGFAWYFLVPTFLSWNATMMINSWAHTWGEVTYKDFHQPDACKARNLGWAWPFMLGDNLHNNHHAYPNAAYNAFEPWQIDPNGLLIRLFEQLGLVWDPIRADPRLLDKNRVAPAPERGAPVVVGGQGSDAEA